MTQKQAAAAATLLKMVSLEFTQLHRVRDVEGTGPKWSGAWFVDVTKRPGPSSPENPTTRLIEPADVLDFVGDLLEEQ